MDIFFRDPSDVPLPPEQVRIRLFRAEPWPDGRRVRIQLEITPFQKRPSSEIEIHNAAGEEITSLTIVEAIDPRMEVTLHLRSPAPGETYTATASLYYYAPEEDAPPVGAAQKDARPPLPSRLVQVDRAETTFVIEG